jgi:hypothetical protein
MGRIRPSMCGAAATDPRFAPLFQSIRALPRSSRHGRRHRARHRARRRARGPPPEAPRSAPPLDPPRRGGWVTALSRRATSSAKRPDSAAFEAACPYVRILPGVPDFRLETWLRTLPKKASGRSSVTSSHDGSAHESPRRRLLGKSLVIRGPRTSYDRILPGALVLLPSPPRFQW